VGAEVADVSDPDAASQLIGAATRQLLPGALNTRMLDEVLAARA
jgi:hypothetical protein